MSILESVSHRSGDDGGDGVTTVQLTDQELWLLINALRVARAQWVYDSNTMRNSNQDKLANTFLDQYLEAGDMVIKLENAG